MEHRAQVYDAFLRKPGGIIHGRRLVLVSVESGNPILSINGPPLLSTRRIGASLSTVNKPLWFDGQLVIGGNTLCALFPGTQTSGGALWVRRASDGKKLWKSDANGGFVSVAISGTLSTPSVTAAKLIALDASDGTKIWGYPASVNTVPAISKGLVYVGSAGGGLVALRASNGKPVWQSSTYSTAGPVVGANAVYTSDTSTVYALRA
jgi:outer membrane protein assembly factor BamB